MSTIIACIDAAGGLGFEGGLPWHVSSELQHFKAFTMGRTLGVGGGTTLPALPGREVIRLSRGGCSLKKFLSTYPDGLIIGGATIFHWALGEVDTVVLSVLPNTYACDCFLNMARVDLRYVLESTVQHDGFEVLTFNRRR